MTTANLNWEILTKKSFTLKYGMGLRLKNSHMGVHWKNLFGGGGVHEKPGKKYTGGIA